MVSNGVDFWGVQYHPEITTADVGRGIRAQRRKYAEFQHLVDDFMLAEEDAEAAARIGSNPRELSAPVRDTELRNWLEHVAERSHPQSEAV